MLFSTLLRPLSRHIVFNPFRSIRFASTKSLSSSLQGPEFLPRETEQDHERLLHLEVQVQEARQPRSRSSYREAVKTEERLGPDGKFRCTRCRLFKVSDWFYVDSRYKYGYNPMCKMCKREQMFYYFSCTLRGIMTRLLCNARYRASKRSNMPLREEAGLCELTLDSLLNLWEKQQGRCEYSGIVMSLDPFTSWRLSLERLDNNLGYVSGNVAFICMEFNTSDNRSKMKNGLDTGSSQWSKSKVQSLPDEIDRAALINFSNEELHKMLLDEKMPKRKMRATKREISPGGLLLCALCEKFKSADADFYTTSHSRIQKHHQCKSCLSVVRSLYRKTFGGFLRTRLSSARFCAAVRGKNGRIDAGEFRLSMADILYMYQQQRGLCFYSGVKLCLQACSEWMCSIERLDNDKGYVRTNVVLICAEFQTSDYSHHAKAPVKGSAQWSREKVEMLLQWLRLSLK